MTLEEILKAKGLNDEQVTEIIGEMKNNKIFTASEENLDVRYGKLKTDHEGKIAELEKANGLISELQKTNKGNEELQGKITDYEGQVKQLQDELVKTKIEAAIKVGLLAEHADDVDYLTFKLREQGDLELDDNGDIKGWADKVSSLKTQFPKQFETSGGAKKIDENKLPEPSNDNREKEPKDLAEALKMEYEAPKD